MSEYQSKSVLTSIRERIRGVTQSQYLGLLVVLVGTSQLPIALGFATDNNQWMLVVGSGGWLLIGIGINLMMGQRALWSDWNESGKHGMISLATLTLLTIAVVVSSIYGLQ